MKLIGLWVAIFASAPLVNGAVTVLSNEQFNNVVQRKSFSEFAEPKLVIALCLGTVIVLFLHRLLKKAITIDETEADWGEDVVDGVMDEISAAATHFACVLFASHLFDRAFHWDSRIGIAMVFTGIAVYTFDARGNSPHFGTPVPGEFEAELKVPLADAVVPSMVPEIAGSLYKRPPKGYALWLVRRWKEDAKEFYPVKKVHFPDGRATTMEFSMSADVGGRDGDYRFLELWLVGPQGAAVFDAWENGNRRFVELQGSNWDQKFLFPGLVKRTDDMVIMLTGRRVEIAK